MSESALASGVLLVGSLPLSNSKEAFTTVTEELPGRLASIPDGETGERYNYIGWERARFPLETLHFHIGGKPLLEGHSGKFTQEDVTASGYDKVAIDSYKNFVELREKGFIPSGIRFQVSVPPPYEAIQGHVRPEFKAQLEPFYEKRVYDALQNILSVIPAEDLALQFDFCFVMTALEYERGREPVLNFMGTQPLDKDFFKPHFTPIRSGLRERIKSLIDQIPENVPIGWHLCYGDLGHQHFIQPEDTNVMVDFANDLYKDIQPHKLAWVHMPVPKSRDDLEYFEPLKRLNLGPETKLYLGLVHYDDEEGTRRRLQTAQTVTKDFGVATECGIGRTPGNELPSILRILKNVSGKVEPIP